MAQDQALQSPNLSTDAHDQHEASPIERKEPQPSYATPTIRVARGKDADGSDQEPRSSPSLGVRDRSPSSVRSESQVPGPRDVRTLPRR